MKETSGIKEFSASETGSFAEFTIRERFPKIFREVCSDEYETFIKTTTVEEGIKNFCHPGLEEVKTAVREHAHKTLEEFFYTAPFFLVEVYFYHLLLCKRNYGKLKFDFFASKKDSSYKDKGIEYSEKLEKLFRKYKKADGADHNKEHTGQNMSDIEIEAVLQDALTLSLKANSGDLSQLNEVKADTVKYLCDETEICTHYIRAKKYQRFDIICDNSGAELFSDIYLSVFFIKQGFTDKVTFHVKPCPFFVSDATMDDFSKLLLLLTNNNKNSELFELLHKKKIEVKESDFWVMPYYFDDMPEDLKAHFNLSDLVVVKGDLNYRRLVRDCNWKSTDTLKQHSLLKDSKGRNIPVIAPRVLKSDLLIGVAPVFKALAQNADPFFKTDGKWGVVHTTIDENKETIKKHLSKKKLKLKRDTTENNINQDTLTSPGRTTNSLGEIIYYSLFSLIALLVITVLGVVAITFIRSFGTDMHFLALLERTDFSLILSSLTLLIGGSIVLPKFLLKQEVKAAVKEEINNNVDENIKNKIKQHVEDKFNSAKNEASKMDSHLSRMVAFFLHKEYPLWSIGWAFRSLKRYSKLDENSIGLKEYSDFVNFIREYILKNVKKRVLKDLEENEFSFAVLEEEAKASGEPNTERPVIRAIKDIVDFEYAVCFTEIKNDQNKFAILFPICKKVGAFARLLCVILLKHRKNKQKDVCTENEIETELKEEISKISQFGTNFPKSSATQNEVARRNDFSKRLTNVLSMLHADTNDAIDSSEEERTFFDIK